LQTNRVGGEKISGKKKESSKKKKTTPIGDPFKPRFEGKGTPPKKKGKSVGGLKGFFGGRPPPYSPGLEGVPNPGPFKKKTRGISLGWGGGFYQTWQNSRLDHQWDLSKKRKRRGFKKVPWGGLPLVVWNPWDKGPSQRGERVTRRGGGKKKPRQPINGPIKKKFFRVTGPQKNNPREKGKKVTGQKNYSGGGGGWLTF